MVLHVTCAVLIIHDVLILLLEFVLNIREVDATTWSMWQVLLHVTLETALQ